MIHILNQSEVTFAIQVQNEEEARLLRNILYNAIVELREIQEIATEEDIRQASGTNDVFNIEEAIQTCADLSGRISLIIRNVKNA